MGEVNHPSASPAIPKSDPHLQGEIDRLESEIAALRGHLPKVIPQQDLARSDIAARLAVVAGVPLEDVDWRVRAGLTPEQAVEAAKAQMDQNQRASGGNQSLA